MLAKKYVVIIASILTVCLFFGVSVYAEDAQKGWCEGVKIRYFVGGDGGDAFSSILYRAAQMAEADLGADVEYIFSGWSPEKMIDQLSEAIASKPDGIAMMGHPGDDAIMPLAEKAAEAGILMMYQNVDLPKVRAKFGGGYVGAILDLQGLALAAEAIRLLGLKAGDQALVIGPWGSPGRYIREEAVALGFEEAGLIVDRLESLTGSAADPSLMIPSITATFLRNPETKIIVYSGGQQLGATEIYMDALGKGPGEIYNIGFDTSAAVIDGFRKGYIQLTSDQQPFLQGYMPILNLCEMKVFGLGGLFIDTGAGFVDQSNFEDVADLATKGYR